MTKRPYELVECADFTDHGEHLWTPPGWAEVARCLGYSVIPVRAKRRGANQRPSHGSPYSEGEKCHVCKNAASHKIGEEDSDPSRHNSTAYLCCSCFDDVMGSLARRECEQAKKGSTEALRHEPRDLMCTAWVQGEPSNLDARCPVCRPVKKGSS